MCIALRLNSCSKSSFVLGLTLSCLQKNSHASSFSSSKRCSASVGVPQSGLDFRRSSLSFTSFGCYFDVETQCLTNPKSWLLGLAWRPWSSFTKTSCEVAEDFVCWKKVVAGKRGLLATALSLKENGRLGAKQRAKAHLGGHDTVRRVDPDGEALV